MKVAINGAGVAGPTLAWWLRLYGHEPTLLEQAPQFRTGGYVIDFWGVGYDVAEKMGLLPALHERGYLIRELRLVNGDGRRVAGMNTESFQALTNGRYLSIPRGDLAAAIHQACGDAETRFRSTIAAIRQHDAGVAVRVNDGPEEEFDLVIGADGLHSKVRSLAFGSQEQFERQMGFHVAAFSAVGYPHRDELVYLSHTEPKRQVARVSLRDDLTMFLLIFRSALLNSAPATTAEQKAALRDIFGAMRWEVPEILHRLDAAESIYFDRVSQIEMPHWSSGRVALLGDAAACVSLLAGEGTGLAMLEAYLLAGELHQADGDHAAAFRRYEEKLQPFLLKKQQGARSFAGFFAPKNRWRLFLRNLGTNLASFPFLARYLAGSALRDTYPLPDYGR